MPVYKIFAIIFVDKKWKILKECLQAPRCSIRPFLRQYKASQKLGVGREMFGVGRKQVYEIDPNRVVVQILAVPFLFDKTIEKWNNNSETINEANNGKMIEEIDNNTS